MVDWYLKLTSLRGKEIGKYMRCVSLMWTEWSHLKIDNVCWILEQGGGYIHCMLLPWDLCKDY